jgi:hypothetical protein
MKARALKLMLATTALMFTLAACSSDEDPTPPGHSQPESARLFHVASSSEIVTNFSLPDGSTTRIGVRFYDADGEDISEELIETGHFTALVFTPSTFATSTAVMGEPFQRDVTVHAAPGTVATLVIGYGHDEAADSEQFGSYNVTSWPDGPVGSAR